MDAQSFGDIGALKLQIISSKGSDSQWSRYFLHRYARSTREFLRGRYLHREGPANKIIVGTPRSIPPCVLSGRNEPKARAFARAGLSGTRCPGGAARGKRSSYRITGAFRASVMPRPTRMSVTASLWNGSNSSAIWIFACLPY